MVWRLAAVAAYLACLVVAFAILNADYSDWQGAFGAAVIGGVILGMGNDFWTSAALTVLAPAVAEPFGYPEKYLGSDAPELWFVGMMLIPFLLVAILIGVGLRKLWGPPKRTA
jgi:hypothetical protein